MKSAAQEDLTYQPLADTIRGTSPTQSLSTASASAPERERELLASS